MDADKQGVMPELTNTLLVALILVPNYQFRKKRKSSCSRVRVGNIQLAPVTEVASLSGILGTLKKKNSRMPGGSTYLPDEETTGV